MNDKADLLDQIKIDRTAVEAPGGISTPVVAGLVVLAASLGALLAYALIPHSSAPASDKEAIEMDAARPTKSDLGVPEKSGASSDPLRDRRILDAAGYVTARRIATVSSEITGRIIDVNVEEGMFVEQGQVLARLDSTVATVDLELAQSNVPALQAQLERIDANLSEARRVLSRTKELRGRSLATEADETSSAAAADALAADFRNASANLEVARLEVKRRQELLDDHIVRAPFAGVVTRKNAQTGEIVSPSSAGGGFTRSGICTIVDMDSLEIEVDVNESFIRRVFPGQAVEAHLDAYPDWDIPATVIAIIPTADRAKATVRVRIRIDAKDTRILPDMGVKVAFLQDRPDTGRSSSE